MSMDKRIDSLLSLRNEKSAEIAATRTNMEKANQIEKIIAGTIKRIVPPI